MVHIDTAIAGLMRSADQGVVLHVVCLRVTVGHGATFAVTGKQKATSASNRIFMVPADGGSSVCGYEFGRLNHIAVFDCDNKRHQVGHVNWFKVSHRYRSYDIALNRLGE